MPCKIHIVKLEKGKSYLINMVSTDLDSYLRIEDSAGAALAQDDDGGGNLNARIRFAPTKDDNFKIIATTFSGGEGNYTLTVKDANAPVAAGKPPVKNEKKIPLKNDSDAPKKNDEVKKDDGAIKLETPTDKKPIDLQGQLQDGDPVDPVRNQPAKTYAVELIEGTAYTIDLGSTDYDAYLRILDAAGNLIAEDDDSGGNLNARVNFIAPAKATYRIVATSFGGGTGAFQLAIRPTASYGKSAKYDPQKVHDGSKNFFISGKLTNQDDKDAVQQQSPCQIHQVKLAKGKTYVIDLISGQMDSYLRIEDSAKTNLAEDDDGGEGLNSRLTFTPTDDGVFRLIATNLDGNAGAYILAIREQK
jgi:hypothetical protein